MSNQFAVSKFSKMIGELNDVDSVVNSASKLGAQGPRLTKPKSAQSAAVVDFPPAATPRDSAQSPDTEGDISPAPTALSPLVCLDEQFCIVEPLST